MSLLSSAHLLLGGAPLLNGLVGYWKLDGDTRDEVSGTTGNPQGMSYAAAVVGQGGVFNGSSSVAETRIAGPLGNNPRSVSLWFKQSSLLVRYIFGYGEANAPGNQAFEIAAYAGQLMVATYGFGTPLAGVANYSAGAWYHVGVTFDGNTVLSYLNGSLVQTWVSGPINTLDAPAGDVLNRCRIRIGDGLYVPFKWFNGSIDEVGVWNRVLTPAEVAELYNSGAGKSHPFS
jgi:hypothetical protein